MINSVSTNLFEDKEAIKSNLVLILSSEKRTLFGDPQFGATLKKYLFEQSHSIVADLVVDEIYSTIVSYIPQLTISRKDITLTTDGTDLFVELKVTYNLDNTSDLYLINLTKSDSF